VWTEGHTVKENLNGFSAVFLSARRWLISVFEKSPLWTVFWKISVIGAFSVIFVDIRRKGGLAGLLNLKKHNIPF